MDKFQWFKKYIFVTNSKNHGFNTGEWYRVLFLEMMLGVYMPMRMVLFLSEIKRYSVWFFLPLAIFITLQFGKAAYLWIAITRRCPTKLRIYWRLTQSLCVVFIFYKFTGMVLHFLKNSLSFVAMGSEVMIFLTVSLTWIWLGFRIVPRYLRNLDKSLLDMAEFKQKMDEYLLNDMNLPDPVNLDNEQPRIEKELDILPDVGSEMLLNSLITPLELNIDISQKIGEGQYNLVYKGSLRKNGKSCEIVGKTGKAGDNCLEALVKEMKIALCVGIHPNILGFYGVTCGPTAGRYFLISEYCPMGSLYSYLDKIRPLAAGFLIDQDTKYVNISLDYIQQELDLLRQELLRYAVEICAGMCHLTEKRVVHGDLASRNVLLTSDLRVKLSDFGMSTKLYNYQLYVHNFQQEFLPWRWMSVEALEDLRFSEKSDVYAFGVTLYELYTLGRLPFDGQDWSLNLPNDMRTGLYKLKRPKLATDKLNDIISKCCDIHPEKRPTFKELNVELQKIRDSSDHTRTSIINNV